MIETDLKDTDSIEVKQNLMDYKWLYEKGREASNLYFAIMIGFVFAGLLIGIALLTIL